MYQHKLNSLSVWDERLVLTNLGFLVFFVFFGTSLPFQERTREVWQEESSNIVNQIVYTFLFLSSLPLLLTHYKALISFVIKEKFLTIFIFISLASAIWSDYSSISIKRSFMFFVVYLVILNAFVFAGFKKILKTLKIVFSIYLMVTFLTCFTIPAAIDPKFGTWRGIELQKNGLGQVGTFFLLFSLLFHDKKANRNSKIFNYLFSLLSVILIFMSGSSTAATAFLLVLFSFGILKFENLFRPLKFGRFISASAFTFAIASLIIVIIFGDQLLKLFPELFGKDLTFTGRTAIWEYVWSEIQKRPILGYGFGTYWIMGSSRLDVFKINQSHNSYLEIMLQLGFIGITILLFIVISFLYRAIKINDNKSLIACIAILTISFSEGILLQGRNEATFTFLFFYVLVSVSFFNANSYTQNEVESIPRNNRYSKNK